VESDEGLLLDAAETLFTLEPPLHQLIAELIAHSGGPYEPERLVRAIRQVGTTIGWPDDQPTQAERIRAWTGFVNDIVTASGLHVSDHISETAALAVVDPARYRVYPEVPALLSRLAATNLPVGIVSNFDDLLYDILRVTRLDSSFPVVISSFQSGFSKPDPRVFQLAAREAHIELERSYFVGDSVYPDMVGAQRAGLHGILLDRESRYPEYPGPRITSLLELIEVLDL
jgi:FMN phosphatase YigB (HAD superfamily)